MGGKKTWVAGLALAMLIVPAGTAAGWTAKLSKHEKVLHALNRLTFGPRPGDVEQVRKLGMKKWLDLQLHPSAISENPELEAKLQPLDTLRMTPAEMARNCPPPQLIKALARGRMEIDPERRAVLERLVERYQRRAKNKEGVKDANPSQARSRGGPRAAEGDV